MKRLTKKITQACFIFSEKSIKYYHMQFYLRTKDKAASHSILLVGGPFLIPYFFPMGQSLSYERFRTFIFRVVQI